MLINNVFKQGDWKTNRPPIDKIGLIIADPIYDTKESIDIVHFAHENNLPLLLFLKPEDIHGLPWKPKQILHWIKPETPKKTTHKYSSFVECIACYATEFHRFIHWSNRTGLFYDRLVAHDSFKWKKPDSLIERLIINHYPGKGLIFDPFAGTRTVEGLCKKYAIPSWSVDDGQFIKYLEE